MQPTKKGQLDVEMQTGSGLINLTHNKLFWSTLMEIGLNNLFETESLCLILYFVGNMM